MPADHEGSRYPGAEFVCECNTEALRVWMPEDEESVYFSLWGNAHMAGKMRWRFRLRCVWKVLRTGKAFDDEVVLSHKAADRLARRLLSRTSGGATVITYTGTASTSLAWTQGNTA